MIVVYTDASDKRLKVAEFEKLKTCAEYTGEGKMQYAIYRDAYGADNALIDGFEDECDVNSFLYYAINGYKDNGFVDLTPKSVEKYRNNKTQKGYLYE